MQALIKVFIWVLFWLLVIGVITYVAYSIYKKESNEGTCKYVPLTADTVTKGVDYTQIGYIKCNRGGEFWTHKQTIISNNGPGIFYISVNNGVKQAIVPNDDPFIINVVDGPSPNVFYASGATNTTPNFTITAN